MKKVLSILLSAVILMASFGLFNAFAQGSQDESNAISFQSAINGTTLSAEIVLTNNTGMAGMILSLQYDTTLFTLQTASNGTVFDSLTAEKNLILKTDDGQNTLRNGVLASLTFEIAENAAPADYTFTILLRECTDASLDDVGCAVQNGIVTIPCPHSNMLKTDAVSATCSATGNNAYWYCETCEKYFSDEKGENQIEKDTWITQKDATNHVGYGTEVRNAKTATCLESGYTGDTWCLGCQTKIGNGADINPLGHSFTSEIVRANNNGTHSFKCIRCEVYGAVVDGKQEENAGVACTYGDFITSNPPACLTAGEKTATCTVCGNIQTESIDPLGHDWGAWTKVNDDQHSRTCQREGCGQVDELKNHRWNDGVETKAPSCTETGVTTFTCLDCGATKTADIQMLAHNYQKTGDTATCTESGTATYNCADCGAPMQQPSDPLGHNMTAHGAVGVTCTEAGNSAYWYCNRCQKNFSDENGETEIEENSWVINALGHDMTAHNAANATCTADGNRAYWSCARCEKFFSDANGDTEIAENSWILEKLGHSFTNYVSNNDATCTADGTKTAKCDRCEETETIADEGTKLGHTFGEWITDAEPTCTENGHRYRICEKDSFKEEETLPATGHTDEDKDNICDVCGADLTPENACEYCGEVHEGFFGKIVHFFHKLILRVKNFFGDFSIGHLHRYETVVTEPTCTGQGYTTHTCKVCGKTYIDDYTDPLGHEFGEWKAEVEATCIAEGLEYRICDRCGEREEQTVKVSSVHKDADGDGVCDLCGKTGVCKYCGKIHDGLFGKIVQAIHSVFYDIRSFFKK